MSCRYSANVYKNIYIYTYASRDSTPKPRVSQDNINKKCLAHIARSSITYVKVIYICHEYTLTLLDCPLKLDSTHSRGHIRTHETHVHTHPKNGRFEYVIWRSTLADSLKLDYTHSRGHIRTHVHTHTPKADVLNMSFGDRRW